MFLMSEVLLTAAFLEKGGPLEREFLIDNMLARNRLIMVMIRWTGLAPWEHEFPFPGCLTSTFLWGGGARCLLMSGLNGPGPVQTVFSWDAFGNLVRSHVERRRSILGQTQSHMSPKIPVYEDQTL